MLFLPFLHAAGIHLDDWIAVGKALAVITRFRVITMDVLPCKSLRQLVLKQQFKTVFQAFNSGNTERFFCCIELTSQLFFYIRSGGSRIIQTREEGVAPYGHQSIMSPSFYRKLYEN